MKKREEEDLFTKTFQEGANGLLILILVVILVVLVLNFYLFP